MLLRARVREVGVNHMRTECVCVRESEIEDREREKRGFSWW